MEQGHLLHRADAERTGRNRLREEKVETPGIVQVNSVAKNLSS